MEKEAIEELRRPKVVALVHSLLGIPPMFKNVAQGMIQRIIKQNVDAKKLPVSSFEWAGILESLGGKSRSKPDLGVTEAIATYNACPEVRAHGGSGSAPWA